MKEAASWAVVLVGIFVIAIAASSMADYLDGKSGGDLVEFQQQAVDYGYAEWADLGYGKTEFRFIEPAKPDVAPEPKPRKPIGAVGSVE